MRKPNKEKKTAIENFVEAQEDPKIVPQLDAIAPAEGWEEARRKKVDFFYENSLFDPDKIPKPGEPPPWMTKMYPGMDFSNVPSHPDDIGRYVTPEKGWEIIPAPKFIESEDGRIHKGDSVWCMRPKEVSKLVQERDDYMRDVANNVIKTPAQQRLEQQIEKFRRPGRKPPFIVGSEIQNETLHDPSGIEGMMERDARRGGPSEDHDPDFDQPAKKYFGGYGPSKIFNQGG
jgi:hypothetical protein